MCLCTCLSYDYKEVGSPNYIKELPTSCTATKKMSNKNCLATASAKISCTNYFAAAAAARMVTSAP
jgi:hypothetical protein